MLTNTQTLVVDTNGIGKKLEEKGFSRIQAEGITEALKESDIAHLVTKTGLELALARQSVTINLLDDRDAAWTRRARRYADRVFEATGIAFKRRQPMLLIVAFLLTFCVLPAQAQEITYLAPSGAPASAFPPAQRPVADIVSPTRSTEKQRDAVDESGQLVRLMELKAGMTVGDIGACNGYHTVRLSPLLGPQGRVIAQDVTRDYLRQLGQRIKGLNVRNVRLALGEPHDPRLPPASLDAAILVHMYHEVAQPYAFLNNLARVLKRGARVGIVDLDKATPQHGTGYLAIFSAPAEHERKQPDAIKPCAIKRR